MRRILCRNLFGNNPCILSISGRSPPSLRISGKFLHESLKHFIFMWASFSAYWKKGRRLECLFFVNWSLFRTFPAIFKVSFVQFFPLPPRKPISLFSINSLREESRWHIIQALMAPHGWLWENNKTVKRTKQSDTEATLFCYWVLTFRLAMKVPDLYAMIGKYIFATRNLRCDECLEHKIQNPWIREIRFLETYAAQQRSSLFPFLLHANSNKIICTVANFFN